MTRKDYELIAMAIRRVDSDARSDSFTMDQVVHALTMALAGANPRFNRVRFAAACQAIGGAS